MHPIKAAGYLGITALLAGTVTGIYIRSTLESDLSAKIGRAMQAYSPRPFEELSQIRPVMYEGNDRR